MPNLSKNKKRGFSHPRPSARFPHGIGPPRKTVTGVRMMNGKQQYQFSYYDIYLPKSCFRSNGNDAELEIALAIAPIRYNTEENENVIDYDDYVKDQEGVLVREKEIIAAMAAIGDKNEEWMRLFIELMENNARKDIPSKDWRPFLGKHVCPELRIPVAVGAPAIEANLPY